jgi:hypothetical protein
MIAKTYLGDGVYAAMSYGGDIILTTENGVETTNTIYLDRDVLNNLNVYINRVIETRKEDTQNVVY